MLSLFQCWLILFGCIASEVTGSVCLKLSNQYQRLIPSILMFVCFAMAMAGFPFALKRIDLGTAYAVWSGVGTAATAAIGIVHFHEKATPLKLAGVIVIIVGVIMLNTSEAQEEAQQSSSSEQVEVTKDLGDATERTMLMGESISSHVTNAGGSV